MSKDELKKEFILERTRTILDGFPQMEIYPMDEQLIEDIKRAGLIIAGARGSGKSNVAKVITSQFVNGEYPEIQVKITDSCQNWIHNFNPIPYQHINEITRFPHGVYMGSDDFIYDIELTSIEEIQMAIGDLVQTDYDLHRLYKKEGLMDEWIIWVIEEAQNVLGTYSLNGKKGERWLKIISECRNFNINFIFVGQRLADISTKAVERCDTYLFGKMTGDNDLKKIQRICGKNVGVHEVVPRLEIGEFIFWNGADAFVIKKTPLFESKEKPRMWTGGMGI